MSNDRKTFLLFDKLINFFQEKQQKHNVVDHEEENFCYFDSNDEEFKKLEPNFKTLASFELSDKSNIIHYIFKSTRSIDIDLLAWLYSFRSGKKLFCKQDKDGYTPLHYFVINQEQSEELDELLGTILDEFYPDVKKINAAEYKNSDTALHYAAILCKDMFFRTILNRTNTLFIKNDQDDTPIELLASKLLEKTKKQDFYLQKIIVERMKALLNDIDPDLVNKVEKNKPISNDYSEAKDNLKSVEYDLSIVIKDAFKELKIKRQELQHVDEEREQYKKTTKYNEELKKDLEFQKRQLMEKTTRLEKTTSELNALNEQIYDFNKDYVNMDNIKKKDITFTDPSRDSSKDNSLSRSVSTKKISIENTGSNGKSSNKKKLQRASSVREIENFTVLLTKYRYEANELRKEHDALKNNIKIMNGILKNLKAKERQQHEYLTSMNFHPANMAPNPPQAKKKSSSFVKGVKSAIGRGKKKTHKDKDSSYSADDKEDLSMSEQSTTDLTSSSDDEDVADPLTVNGHYETIKKLQEQISGLKEQKQKFENECEQSSKALKKLRKKVEEKTKALEVEEEEGPNNKDYHELQLQLDDKIKQIDHLKEKYQTIEKENEELKKSQQSIKQENNDLKQNQQLIEQENAHLKEENNKLEEFNTTLSSQLEISKQNLNRLEKTKSENTDVSQDGFIKENTFIDQSDYEETLQKMHELKEKNIELNQSVLKLETDIEELQKLAESSKKEMNEVVAECEELDVELTSVRKQLLSVKQENEGQKEQLEEYKEQIQNYEKQNQLLNENIKLERQESEKNISELTKNINDMAKKERKKIIPIEDYNTILEENQELEQQIDALQQKIAKIEQEKDFSLDENEILNQENENLRQENQRLLSETQSKIEQIAILNQKCLDLEKNKQKDYGSKNSNGIDEEDDDLYESESNDDILKPSQVKIMQENNIFEEELQKTNEELIQKTQELDLLKQQFEDLKKMNQKHIVENEKMQQLVADLEKANETVDESDLIDEQTDESESSMQSESLFSNAGEEIEGLMPIKGDKDIEGLKKSKSSKKHKKKKKSRSSKDGDNNWDIEVSESQVDDDDQSTTDKEKSSKRKDKDSSSHKPTSILKKLGLVESKTTSLYSDTDTGGSSLSKRSHQSSSSSSIKKKIKILQTKIDHKKDELSRLDNEVTEKEKLIQEKQNEINNLRDEESKLKARIQMLQTGKNYMEKNQKKHDESIEEEIAKNSKIYEKRIQQLQLKISALSNFEDKNAKELSSSSSKNLNSQTNSTTIESHLYKFKINELEEMAKRGLKFCREKDHKNLKKYLACGAPVNIADKDGKNMLEIAVEQESLECVQLIIDNGGDHHDVKYLMARSTNFPKIKKCLVDRFETPPFLKYIEKEANDTNMMKAFKSIYTVKNTNDCPDRTGKTYLNMAIEKAYIIIVEELLKMKSNPNLSDDYGNLPLHVAINVQEQAKKLSIVELLLAFGADPMLPRGEIKRKQSGENKMFLKSNNSSSTQRKNLDSAYNLCKDPVIKKMFDEPKYRKIEKNKILNWIQSQAQLNELYSKIKECGFELGHSKTLFVRYENYFDYFNIHYPDKAFVTKEQAQIDTEYILKICQDFRTKGILETMQCQYVKNGITKNSGHKYTEDNGLDSASSSSRKKKSRPKLMKIFSKKSKKSSKTRSVESDDQKSSGKKSKKSTKKSSKSTNDDASEDSYGQDEYDETSVSSSVVDTDVSEQEYITHTSPEFDSEEDNTLQSPPPPLTVPSPRQLRNTMEEDRKKTLRSKKSVARFFTSKELGYVEEFHAELLKRPNAIINEEFEVSNYVSDNAYKSFDEMAKESYKSFIRDGSFIEITYMDNNQNLYPNLQNDLKNDNFVPAIESIRKGKTILLKYFLEKDKQLLKREFQNNTTLFTEAISCQQPMCLAILDFYNFEFFDVESNNAAHYRITDSKGDSAAHSCIIARLPKILEYVLTHQPKLLEIKNKLGQTPHEYVKNRLEYYKKKRENVKESKRIQMYMKNTPSEIKIQPFEQHDDEITLQNLEECMIILNSCQNALEVCKKSSENTSNDEY